MNNFPEVPQKPEYEMPWMPSREAAIKRLHAFVPRAGQPYRARRNEDRGANQHHYVSGLSPYLRHRLLLDQEVLEAVLAHHTLEQAAKFIEEVFWRSYFKGWLEHHPGVWTRYTSDCEQLRRTMKHDTRLRTAYSDAIFARTGIAPFDAWVSELRTTGYLHNHARMWFASIWIFTLGLPWQLGAQWFHYHLLDGDAASNTLSWRWVAGLHTKGKTYLARADNIRRYAGQRFNKTLNKDNGAESLDGLAQLAQSAPALGEDPAITALLTPTWPDECATPAAGERIGLLLHDEDMSLTAPVKPDAIAMFAPQRVGRKRSSRRVAGFALRASINTLADANEQLAVDTPARFLRSRQAAIQWMQDARLDRLLVPYVPQGPSQHRIHNLLEAARNLGVTTELFMRPLDRLAWPHASKGFFALRKRIPDILEDLSITASPEQQRLPL
ncbi:MAG: FAD-binding domain-containing protein [bacterium]